MSLSRAPRVAVVTGASSGIGLACAGVLAEAGFRVYGASRSAPPAAKFVPIAMDVTSDDSVRAAIASVAEHAGRIDVLVNNAGFGIAGAIEDTSPGEARAQFDVNLFGVLRVCRAALPIMRDQGQGHIVNIGSIGGLIAIPYQGFYSASKFALEGFTEALRMELRQFGIRVVLVEPGDYRTGFTGRRIETAASGTGSPYAEPFQRALGRMQADERGAASPLAIGRLVRKIVTKRHPRLRYTAGPAPQRVAVWLKRALPHSAIERMVRAYYGS